MRPHRLRMTAFGPFPGTVEVDLDRLAAGGLFLLHGETGAGKTTLLDGLGFALYGRAPGLRPTSRLRSDHADHGVRTEVVLDVTLGGRLWRITRSPAQERSKARGTGTTTEQARVLLEVRRGSDWETVSTRIDEAAAELDPLLGMSAEQFFQVVLLPQGEFARFLRADNDGRRQLLQRLFGTERFKAVEDWLAGRRASTAAGVAAARHELQVLAARLAQAAGLVAPDEPEPEWAAGVVACCTAARDAGQQAAAVAAGERDVARGAATAAVRLADRQARRRAALTAGELLDREVPEHDLLAAELQAAARAAELAPVLSDAAAREQASAVATVAQVAARSRLGEIGLPAGLALPALRDAADAARVRSGRLDGLRGLADDLSAERSAEVGAARDVAASGLAAERAGCALALLPSRRRRAREAVTVARTAVAQLPDAQATLASLVAALREARGLAAVLEVRADLRDEHLLARETAVSLREKEGELREARLTSMLAELADKLEPGAPCEVCGSLQHPDPYEGAGEGVTREDEERARRDAEVGAHEVAELAARLASASATADGHRARLAASGHDGADVPSLVRRHDDTSAEVDRVGVLAAGLDEALAVAECVEAEQVGGDAELARALADGEAAARRCAEARLRAERLHSRLLGELDGAPDLAAALSAAAITCEVCEAVIAAAEQAERDGREAERVAVAASAAALAVGFTSPEQARDALRPADWREQAAQRRREHDDRRAAIEAALADPELAVDLDPPADVDGTGATLREADAELDRAVGILAAAHGRATEVATLAPQVSGCWQGLVPLQEHAGRVRRLADLCGGQGANALKMTLTSFVLAARLEEVAGAASGRLLRMTQGRYTLVHTDGAARGGARSGLGLLVRDSWTGRDRETSTLSGGETFQASLALALGLADVVQAEAGGTRIEALFVDEGFGTLDEETLDEVMDVLDGLREGGRVVGLVSHVGELKARIPAQVHVHKGREGSTLTVCGC